MVGRGKEPAQERASSDQQVQILETRMVRGYGSRWAIAAGSLKRILAMVSPQDRTHDLVLPCHDKISRRCQSGQDQRQYRLAGVGLGTELARQKRIWKPRRPHGLLTVR